MVRGQGVRWECSVCMGGGWWGCVLIFFFFNDTATTEIYTLSLHDALPICVDSLQKLMSEPWFESLSIAFKRAMKILPEDSITGKIDSELVSESAEKELIDSVQKAESDSRVYLDSGNYFEALKKICEIRSSVDRFFDEVLVMTDDLKVRENRFRILKRIVDLFSDIADFRQVSSGK